MNWAASLIALLSIVGIAVFLAAEFWLISWIDSGPRSRRIAAGVAAVLLIVLGVGLAA